MKYELTVSDQGRLHTLDYEGLLAFHGGGAVAGATIGFRIVQAAANELRRYGNVLERESIKVTSGHPGPGYQDAFEYTLRCVSRDRFTVDRDLPEARFSPFHAYSFQFIFVDSTLEKQVSVTLQEDILPTRFFEVLHDLKGQKDDLNLKQELDNLKHAIAQKTMESDLHRLFETRVVPIVRQPSQSPTSSH